MNPSLALKSPIALPVIGGFTAKLFLALALVALADFVFDGGGSFGSASAGFAAVWLVGLWLTRPALRGGTALLAYAFAWAMAVVLLEDPNALAALLFWCGLTLAVMLPRAARFGDVRRWARRLLWMIPAMIALPIVDVATWLRSRRRGRAANVAALALTAAPPVIGGAIFILLFAQANPIIDAWLSSLRTDFSGGSLTAGRIAFWVAIALIVWASLRQVRMIRFKASSAFVPAERKWAPAPDVASVQLSLVVFNALFAIENALDVAFLWSGAPLPAGVTLADYAHRGAYPLIATALLAGGFALYALRPGAPGADSRTTRALISVWIAQNIFLVASSIHRTIDYVEVYSLTRLRLAALIWMGLVAVGLALICWRILREKSGAWLINANAAALVATLSVCAYVDLGEIAARFNVRHAGGIEAKYGFADLYYLERLGPSALGALIELEDKTSVELFRDRVRKARERIESRLTVQQSDWRSWTWRGARRLAAARKALAERPVPGFITVPPAPAEPAPSSE